MRTQKNCHKKGFLTFLGDVKADKFQQITKQATWVTFAGIRLVFRPLVSLKGKSKGDAGVDVLPSHLQATAKHVIIFSNWKDNFENIMVFFTIAYLARVRIMMSTPYEGWDCNWFSPLLRKVVLRVFRFYPLLKNQHFQQQLQTVNV